VGALRVYFQAGHQFAPCLTNGVLARRSSPLPLSGADWQGARHARFACVVLPPRILTLRHREPLRRHHGRPSATAASLQHRRMHGGATARAATWTLATLQRHAPRTRRGSPPHACLPAAHAMRGNLTGGRVEMKQAAGAAWTRSIAPRLSSCRFSGRAGTLPSRTGCQPRAAHCHCAALRDTTLLPSTSTTPAAWFRTRTRTLRGFLPLHALHCHTACHSPPLCAAGRERITHLLLHTPAHLCLSLSHTLYLPASLSSLTPVATYGAALLGGQVARFAALRARTPFHSSPYRSSFSLNTRVHHGFGLARHAGNVSGCWQAQNMRFGRRHAAAALTHCYAHLRKLCVYASRTGERHRCTGSTGTVRRRSLYRRALKTRTIPVLHGVLRRRAADNRNGRRYTTCYRFLLPRETTT